MSLQLSQVLLEIESENEEDETQRPSSQNTLVVAATALNSQASTSTSSVPPFTQRGLPAVARGITNVEYENVATMHPANVEIRVGLFEEIKRRLIQESQEQRNATNVTPVSVICRVELF